MADRPVGEPLLEPVVAPLPDEPALEPVVDSIASQYSASVPLLLPIAWLNSHMISGWRCAPERAWATSAAIGGYIGQMRSLAVWSLDQSNLIAPS